MIQNSDGTVSFNDVTDYDTVGSSIGAAQINAQNTKINQNTSAISTLNADLTEINGKLDKQVTIGTSSTPTFPFTPSSNGYLRLIPSADGYFELKANSEKIGGAFRPASGASVEGLTVNVYKGVTYSLTTLRGSVTATFIPVI
jgi:hypothetical protein